MPELKKYKSKKNTIVTLPHKVYPGSGFYSEHRVTAKGSDTTRQSLAGIEEDLVFVPEAISREIDRRKNNDKIDSSDDTGKRKVTNDGGKFTEVASDKVTKPPRSQKGGRNKIEKHILIVRNANELVREDEVCNHSVEGDSSCLSERDGKEKNVSERWNQNKDSYHGNVDNKGSMQCIEKTGAHLGRQNYVTTQPDGSCEEGSEAPYDTNMTDDGVSSSAANNLLSRRKLHKSYKKTWYTQLTSDGFAKCLIKTCNFISLDIVAMEDHYRLCDGVQRLDSNLCSYCQCWLPSLEELGKHEAKCKRYPLNDGSLGMTKSIKRSSKKDVCLEDGQVESNNDCLVTTNGDDQASPEKKHSSRCQIKLDEETDMKKKRDPNRWVSTMLRKWSTEAFNEECIIQPGRVLPKTEYVRRRAYTKRHKIAWEDAIKKYKFVKCIFQNCHFIGLSVQDMMSHFGYCNGDSSFAEFVCPFCEGHVTSELYLKIHIRRSHADSNDSVAKIERGNEDKVCDTSSHSQDAGSEDGEEHGGDASTAMHPIVKLEVSESESEGGKLMESPNDRTGCVNERRDRNVDGADEANEHSGGSKRKSERERGKKEIKDDHLCSQQRYLNKKGNESDAENDSSLMVMKNNNLKHYSGPKKGSGKDQIRVDRNGNKDIDTAEVNGERFISSSSTEHMNNVQFTEQTNTFSFPSVQTVKRRVQLSYTRLWMDSIDRNGFARCLIATCNFISLDLFHVQNHFRTCNGVPAKGPNLCNLCECRLPSTVELSLHVAQCKANSDLIGADLQNQSRNDDNEDKGCDADGEEEDSATSEAQTIDKETSNDISVTQTEPSEAAKEESSRRVKTITYKTAALRIADIMKLKENEMDPDLIIQQGPDLPKHHYVRRRAYTKKHKAVWELTFAKHKYLKCMFQNCHFLAMSLEDMIYHFGYCIGDGSFAPFPCPYCGGRVTTEAILNLHIKMSHKDEERRETSVRCENAPPTELPVNSESLIAEQLDGVHSEEDELDLPSVEVMKNMFAQKQIRTYGKKVKKTNKVEKVNAIKMEPDSAQLGETRARTTKTLDCGQKECDIVKMKCAEDCYNKSKAQNGDDGVSQGMDASEAPVTETVPECDGAEQTSRSGNSCSGDRGGGKGGNPAGDSSSGEKKVSSRRRKIEDSSTGNDDDEERDPAKRRRMRRVSETDDEDESNAEGASEENDATPAETRAESSSELVASLPRKRGRPTRKSQSASLPVPLPPLDQRKISERDDGDENIAETPETESEMTPSMPKIAESSSYLIPAPRKRGRPPKNAQPSSSPVPQLPVDTPKTKGRRGRKPKNAEEVPDPRDPSDNVKCAKCEFESKRSQFAAHNMRQHVGLSWIEGEAQPDLTDEEYVSWAIKQAFKVIKSATCENCNDTKKSALGFISHIQSCGKSDEEKKALKVTCPLCPRKVLKYSLPTHMRLSHSDAGATDKRDSDVEESGDDVPAKRRSAIRAVDKFQEALKYCGDDEEKTMYVRYEKGVSKFPKIPVRIRGLWSKMRRSRKTIPCRRGSCLVESTTVQEAKKHHFLCPELPDVSFVCQLCDYYSTTESAAKEHVTIHPSKDGDFCLGSEEDNVVEEEEEMEVDEEVGEEGVRTRAVSDATKELETTHRMQFFVREGILKSKMIRFCRRSLRMTLDAETCEIIEKTLPDMELETMASDWSYLPADEASKYLPSLKESISFHVEDFGKANKPLWQKLKLFEGKILNGYPMFFAGGSILSMSWSKISYVRSCRDSTRQYLAVSASRTMDKLRCVREQSKDTSGLIQIWDCGEMRTFKSEQEDVPKMVMGIVHNSGEVWELSWFPVDTYQARNGKQWATRLGLLGAACEDGTIRIWPVCDPNELEKSAGLPLYKVDPSVILELEGKPKEPCLRLAIGRSGIIVGGYAHGIVAVWNLGNLMSPFCKTVGRSKVLKPHLSFQAHKRSITALSICPREDRYIVTSGLDRLTKFWDLECPSGPFETLQKEVCLDHIWPRQWAMTIFAFEDVVPSTGRGMMKGVRDALCDRLPSPLAVDNTCWSMTYSEWFNAIAGCNNVGEVRVRLLRNLFLADERLRFRRGNILSVTELKYLKGAVESSDSISSETGKGKKKENKAVPRTYEEALQFFGLVMTDYPVVDDLKRMITTRTCKSEGSAPDAYPITSVNKVSWNPNYDSFVNLAMGHHSGLIRIRPATDAKSDDEVRRFFREAEYAALNVESRPVQDEKGKEHDESND